MTQIAEKPSKESALNEALLTKFQNSGPERVGFVLQDGEVVEVPNILGLEDADEFQVAGIHIMEYVISGRARATWHTHPRKDANLTVIDQKMFLSYPELEHYIIGTDGLRRYIVKNGRVING